MTDRTRAGTKILHIEDNPENRMLVRALLEAEGYTVVEVEDGLSGIEAAIREAPALILLDINLPGIDGYEVGLTLKSFPALATTPVIAVTAYAMEGDRQRALAAGCDGYIAKPIDVDTFPRQVAGFLEGKRERLATQEVAPYLRELNQRLVARLVRQVDELRLLNEHVVQRAGQLEGLHAAVQDVTLDLGVPALLERLLPALARALGVGRLTVVLDEPPGLEVVASGTPAPRAAAPAGGEEWVEAVWELPLLVRDRRLGVMTAHLVLPPTAQADREQLLKIVANQVAIAVDNARLYQEAQRALVALQAKNAELDGFAYSVSHDLKAPLVAIQGMAKLLGEDCGERLGDDGLRYLERIGTNVEKMERLIQDLLALARIGREARPPELVDLDEVVACLLDQCAPQIQARGVTVRTGSLGTVWAVRPLIEQVFSNLVGNALKYLGDTPTPRVDIGARERPGSLEYYVRDTGIGIDPAYHGKVFEMLQRLHDVDVEGTGLGLPIVKKIVEAAGGRIWLESAKGQGATFYFTWPRVPSRPVRHIASRSGHRDRDDSAHLIEQESDSY